MAAQTPHDLDGFLPLLLIHDIKMKVTIGSKLFTYLEEPSNSIECLDIGKFIDYIIQWLSNSNPKVTQYGFEIITQLLNRMRTNFKPYIRNILPISINRLGDNKESIKVLAFFLIMRLMECDTISPQELFDHISTDAFFHKNTNVKEGLMKLLISTIEEFGANCLSISKIVPMIVKLLNDPNIQVRNKAFETLVELYRHVGEKLRIDMQKKYSITQNKMIDLMKKFDEVKNTGNLLPTTCIRPSLDNVDKTYGKSTLAPRCTFSKIKRPSSFFPPDASTPLHQPGSTSKLIPVSTSSCTGGVNENTFFQSFEDVPTLQIVSIKDLENTMKTIRISIEDCNERWNKRVDSLKKIRSLVLLGVTKYKEFFNHLRYFEQSFQICVKDLRSQVVKETCISIAFLSLHLGIKFDHFAESIFYNLIELIPNSAKVIASSGLVAIRFILKYTLVPRIIPVLAISLGSKSKDIRCACCEFLNQILRTWPTQVLKIHTVIFQDSIKKGMTDADSNARLFSRNAFWGFCKQFPEEGELLLNKLEPTYRKILLKNSGSNFCFPKSIEDKGKLLPCHTINSQLNNSKSSNSAIEFQAAQKTKAHTDYVVLPRQKADPSIISQSDINKTNKIMNQIEINEKPKSRLSISQPTSRLGSPFSKSTFDQHKLQRSYSRIPRSQNTRREASLDKFSILGSYSIVKSQPFILTKNKRKITQQLSMESQETEFTFTDVRIYTTGHKSEAICQRKCVSVYSDESEIAIPFFSECSINSLGHTSVLLNRSKIHSSKGIKENSNIGIEDIILNCEKSNWNNRKKGLSNLQSYLLQGNIINIKLLKKLTDVLINMFMDSKTKSISLFLDTLNKLIITHSQYLEYWLYILLVKLFNKGGSDICNSIFTKLLETTEVIMKSFPCNLQLNAVFKFLTDLTLTPNDRIKIFALNYVSKLAITTNSSSAFPPIVVGKKDFTTLALTKIIDWIMCNNIKQDPELRRISQETILTLYSLNASQIILRLTQLPVKYQEVISRLLKIKVRRNSVDCLLSKRNEYQQLLTSFASPPLQPDFSDTYSSEKYKLLKPTIQVQNFNLDNHNIDKKDVASYDSELNQISLLNLCNNQNIYNNNGYAIVDELKQILDYLLKDTVSSDCKESILNHLKELVEYGPTNLLMKNFKKFIKVFLKLSGNTEPNIIRKQSITLITCLIQKPEMTSCFHNFTELILMKLLGMCCDSYKPIVKIAEKCSFVFCESLQPETIFRIIIPMMSAKKYPMNLISMNIMTKLIDKNGKLLVSNQLKEIMSILLQGYSNSDSTIRKSAVLCMVSLQKVVGEQQFAPLISGLSTGKLKLLNLYIKRA